MSLLSIDAGAKTATLSVADARGRAMLLIIVTILAETSQADAAKAGGDYIESLAEDEQLAALGLMTSMLLALR